MARWRGGAVARWRGGAVARWRGGAVARWRGAVNVDYWFQSASPSVPTVARWTRTHARASARRAGWAQTAIVRTKWFNSSNCPIISAGSILILAWSIRYLADLSSRNMVDI